MKKTLIALAAVAATGAAFAQSSVTLYGVADGSLAKVTGASAAVSSAGTMNNGTSRWGVRGTEDLGDGLKAGFNFEQGLSLGDGSLAKSGAGEFGRAAWLNLAGGFGDLRVGRSLSANFYGVAAWELTGTANYSAVVSQFGFAGGSRNNAQIMYTSPNFSGVSFAYGHVLKGNNAGNAKNAFNVKYAAGPLAAALTYAKTSGDAAAGKSLGASYDLGMVKLAGGYFNNSDSKKGVTLGGSFNAGPVNLTLDIARDTEAKDTDMLVEVRYPMSKRSTFYTSFLRDGKNSKGALGATTKDLNGLGIGIRHNF